MRQIHAKSVEDVRREVVPGRYYHLHIPPALTGGAAEHMLFAFSDYGSYNSRTMRFCVLTSSSVIKEHDPIYQYHHERDFTEEGPNFDSKYYYDQNYDLSEVDPLDLPLYAGDAFLTPQYRRELERVCGEGVRGCPK